MSRALESISEQRLLKLTELLQKLHCEEVLLDKNLSKNEFIQRTLFVDQALTHSSAKAKYNYEDLEFFGDAVLRLAATEFLEKYYPNVKLGKKSELRAHIVSDKFLQKVGQHFNISAYTSKSHKLEKAALAKIETDATEALIGAMYKCLNSTTIIHQWLIPSWQSEIKKFTNQPFSFNCKSGLQEWSQAQDLGLPIYVTEEQSKNHGHPERFRSVVRVKDRIESQGTGKSRKEAEEQAACKALKELNQDPAVI